MKIFLSLFLLFIFCSPVKALTLDEAYALIAHEHDPYDETQSSLDRDHSAYFRELFRLIDKAILMKAELLQKMYHEQPYGFESYKYDYDWILEELAAANVPAEISAAHVLIQQAVNIQLTFFENWHEAKGEERLRFKNYASDPQVLAAHEKLLQAYALIQKAFPQESQYNQSVLYNHLCTLDFI